MHNNDNQTQEQTRAFRPFPDMVEALFKKMDSDSTTLMHATVGMVGEATELLEGFLVFRGNAAPQEETHKNLREELGDWRFYAQKVWNIFGWEWDSFVLPAPDANSRVPKYAIEAFVIGAGTALDISKKAWVYNKELDTLALYDAMVKMVTAYRDLLHYFCWTDELICNENQAKLAVRYPDGVYSDAAAIARADKQDEVGAENA